MRGARVPTVLASLVTLVLVGLPQAASAANTGREAVQRFGSCLAAGGSGHLVLLLDTSGSLRETDPGDFRVEAATYLIEQLSSFTEQSGTQLEVAVAGFSDSFDVTLGWTNLAGGGTSQVLGAVDEYTERDSGIETDYWVAVNGARKYLTEKAAPDDCSALVWLSDGVYDLVPRDTDQERDTYGTTKQYGPEVSLTSEDAARRLEVAGSEDLCRVGGVADALRVEGITTLAIGLKGKLEASDFGLMKGIAIGGGSGREKCGAQDGRRSGAFVLADDVGSLFFAFDEIVDPDHLPITNETNFCQGQVCSEFAHEFVLDPSITSVRVLGGSDLEKFFAVVISPSGKEVRIDPISNISGEGAGFEVGGSWLSNSVFSIVLDRTADQGWTGAWKVVFVDPDSTDAGTARTNIRLYGDLLPAWTNNDDLNLVAGATAPMQFGLQREDGTSVDPDSIEGSIEIDAQLEYADGTTIPIASALSAADLGDPVALDLSAAPVGKATVHLTLGLTTAPAGSRPGTTLEPQAVDYRTVVAAPPSYPSLAEILDFGVGDSADPATSEMGVYGGGCVWLASSESLTLPDGLSSVAVDSDATSEVECAEERIELTLTPDGLGTGLASGTLHFMAKPANSAADPIPVTVNYRYEMERPPNETIRWFVFVVFLLLGLLIPLVLLLFVKWLTARVPGPSLSWLAVSGPVTPDGSFLDQMTPNTSDIQAKSLEGSDRRLVRLTARTTLRAKSKKWALAAPGHVVVEGGRFTSSVGDYLPLAVQNHWLAVLDPVDQSGQVEVVFLLTSGGEALQDLVSDARANLPEAVSRLRGELGIPTTPSSLEDSWISPAGPGLDRGDDDDDW
ncbi:hypothetical protein BH09ACT11_BH09ACT11_06540 [soil metagenome]